MRHVLLIIFIASLVGCQVTPVREFDRGDTTEAKFSQDTAGCELLAHDHQTQDLWLWGNPNFSHSRTINECMLSKGYAVKS